MWELWFPKALQYFHAWAYQKEGCWTLRPTKGEQIGAAQLNPKAATPDVDPLDGGDDMLLRL